MKKRRTAIIAFLLCACLAIGAGYAAVTDSLHVSGTANYKTTGATESFDAKVYFAEAVADKTDNTITIDGTTGDDADKARFTISSLQLKDDTAVFTLTIHNKSLEYDAKVTVDAGYPSSTNDVFFAITTNISAEGLIIPRATSESAPGSATFTVTVSLKATPLVETMASFVLDLTAEAVAPTI